MKLLSKIALLIILLVSLTGCAAVVVGGAAAGATYTYTKGWLAKDYLVGFKVGYRASIKALEHHDLKIIDKGKDVNRAFVRAKGAKREIRIRLKRVSRRITTISIRVGVMGDREASKMIHRTIKRFI
jgi:hypothetical protein